MRWIADLFRRRELEAEMSEEMRLHLERRVEENVASGMSAEEARWAALRKFGGVEQVKERCRDGRRGAGLEHAARDMRHGVRLLFRAPGFAAAAVASLALGVAATTAMFSVVHGVLLRPLPYREPERIVMLWSENRQQGGALEPTSLANVMDWSAQTRALRTVAAFDPVSVVVMSDVARRTSAVRTTPELAEALGVSLAIGRMFTMEEMSRGAAVAVVSHAAWQAQLGGRSDVVGQRVTIDGAPTEIVGVLRAGVAFPDSGTEFWLPAPAQAPSPRVRVGSWRGIGRLAPGVTLAAAQAEATGIGGTLEQAFPASNAQVGVRLVPLTEQLVGRDLRRTLLLLLGAVAAVLLIACANVGNLLLARGLARQREFALRLSLGASRRRLIAQLLVENVVLGLPAVGLGLALAVPALAAVRAFGPPDIPGLAGVALDGRVFAVAAALSLACACAFGVVTALQTTRVSGARGATAAPRERRLRSVLVVSEFALALVLLAGATALARSLGEVLAIDPGFRADNVMFAGTRLSAGRPTTDAAAFAEAATERVTALPGVASAAVSQEVLLGDRGERTLVVPRAGAAEPATVRLPLASDAVTPGYFRTLGVDVRDGREFTPHDRAGAPLVAIVSETLARRLWPNEPAVGQRLRLGVDTAFWTVVGVVADQRRQQIERAPIAQVYWPFAQRPSRAMNVIVRTQLEPAAMAASVRRAVQAVDPTVPVEAVTTLRAEMDRRLAPRRFHTGLLALFAGMAFVLAGVGIFGLMHYSVVRRIPEIGVRAALGATRGQIMRDVLREGLALAALGVGLGLAGAVALLRAIASLLYGVAPADPRTLAIAGGALLVLALAACVAPARRASRVDPMVALRTE